MIFKRQDYGKGVGVKVQEEFNGFDDIPEQDFGCHRVTDKCNEMRTKNNGGR
jgi:hypothetical protein